MCQSTPTPVDCALRLLRCQMIHTLYESTGVLTTSTSIVFASLNAVLVSLAGSEALLRWDSGACQFPAGSPLLGCGLQGTGGGDVPLGRGV
jgi:hypothetical protein